MPATRRRPFVIGGSKAVTLPMALTVSKEVSMAAGERLVLIDTTGQVPEDVLLQFFMQHVEPVFQKWIESLKSAHVGTDDSSIRPQQAAGEIRAMEASAVVPQGALPGAAIYDVTCARCGSLFRWDISRGYVGYCPYCGAYLRARPSG